MELSDTKQRILGALQAKLEEKGVTLAAAEKLFGKRPGWLWDRKRVCFDVGEFWDLLVALRIDPPAFLAETFPEVVRKEEPPSEEGPFDELGEMNWAANVQEAE